MKSIYFVAFSGRSFMSKMIKFFTRSEYSHIAIMLDDGKLIEAWTVDGSKIRAKWMYSSFKNHKPKTRYEIYKLDVDDYIYERAMLFYHYLAKTGFPYNYLGVIGFVIPFFTSNGGYFCSEGAWEGLRFADFNRYGFLPGWKISPDKFVDLLKLMNAVLVESGQL